MLLARWKGKVLRLDSCFVTLLTILSFSKTGFIISGKIARKNCCTHLIFPSYLIQVQQLVPDAGPEHGAPVGRADHQPPELAHPRHPGRLELVVVRGEVLLQPGPLLLGGAGTGAEQVLGVVLVVHALEAGDAQRREEQGHGEVVRGAGADALAHGVEQPLQQPVHDLDAHLVCVLLWIRVVFFYFTAFAKPYHCFFTLFSDAREVFPPRKLFCDCRRSLSVTHLKKDRGLAAALLGREKKGLFVFKLLE